MTYGEKLKTWIDQQHAAGRTVYACTYLKVIKIAPKHASMLKLSGSHVMVQRGKRWEAINGCRCYAQ